MQYILYHRFIRSGSTVSSYKYVGQLCGVLSIPITTINFDTKQIIKTAELLVSNLSESLLKFIDLFKISMYFLNANIEQI